jgi:hypothetical protein
MISTRTKIAALVLLVGGLVWGQQLIASSRVPVCQVLWPGVEGCLDGGCCLGIPDQCPNVCKYVPAITDCECLPR